MVAKIKSGDLVKVIRGKDRGKEGTVKQVLSNDRLIVEGVQIVKKHVRATQQGQQAGIVSTEAPIHRSNVMVIDPETKQPTRVGITVKEEARDGNHLEAQFQAPFLFFGTVHTGSHDVFADRCIVMDDVGTHADHVDVHVPVKEDVIGQIAQGLAGQADHVPCPDLVADAAQAVQAVLADLPAVMAVLGMERRVEVGVARFDAQEIAVGAGVEPAAVRFFRLFTDAEGQAQFAVAQGLDVAD